MTIRKKIKLDLYFIPHTKINSKQVKQLKAIVLLEENIGGNLHDTDLANNFLDVTLKIQSKKSKNGEVGFHQTKKILNSRENNQRSEKSAYRTEKIFAKHIPDKKLI